MLVPISKPGEKNNKTGDWAQLRPVLVKECIKCGICEKFCPDSCIKFGVADYDYCKGCGICSRQCPVKAIEMK